MHPYASANHPGAGRQRPVGAGGVPVLEEGLVWALGTTAWSGRPARILLLIHHLGLNLEWGKTGMVCVCVVGGATRWGGSHTGSFLLCLTGIEILHVCILFAQ